MDAHALDLPDDYYDIATSGLVIHLVADRCVLTELPRVLRPGGTVALTTPWP
jgi:ubiquinone/menaquinone biosynthesis C-methylase UbiE